MLAAITTQIDIAKATKEVISNKFDGQAALEDDAYKKPNIITRSDSCQCTKLNMMRLPVSTQKHCRLLMQLQKYNETFWLLTLMRKRCKQGLMR